MGDFHQQLSLPELQIKQLNTQDGATCTLRGYKLKLGLLAQILLCSQISGPPGTAVPQPYVSRVHLYRHNGRSEL